jgi:hypothetical protein
MDNAIRSSVIKGDLWQQRTGGKTAAMASRLVGLRVNIYSSKRKSLHRSDSLKCGFKKPGKNAMNVYRAVMITGPPGIGKTTSAHLCAKLEGFTPIELNASDARSKKLVEVNRSGALPFLLYSQAFRAV